jgi:hypothetical protein
MTTPEPKATPPSYSTAESRRLEANLEQIKKDSMVPGLTVRAEMVRIKGHRDCLESMAPVLAAVKASLGELHEYYCSPVQPCPLCETLADALAALGLEVGE